MAPAFDYQSISLNIIYVDMETMILFTGTT